MKVAVTATRTPRSNRPLDGNSRRYRRIGLAAPVAICILASTSLVGAGTLTVGVSGEFPLIQQAIDEAAAAGGVNEIRVERGLYAETLTLHNLEPGEELSLSGGWNSSFTQSTADPSLTTIDANGGGRALDFGVLEAGAVIVENLTFTGGIHSRLGGGVFIDARGSASVEFLNNRVIDNEVSGDIEATGAGLYARSLDESTVLISSSAIVGNRAIGTDDASANGAGAFLNAAHESWIRFLNNEVGDNLATAPGGRVRGAGVFAAASQSSAMLLEDNRVVGNRADITLVTGCSSGLRIETRAGSTATLIARRNRVLANLSLDKPCVQVDLFAVDGPIVMTDSLIAGGTSGVNVAGSGVATVTLTNLTVTDHEIRELFVTSGEDGAVSLSNTIAFGREPLRLNRSIHQTNNLIGIDPLFLNAAAGDFRLRPGSPGLNAGSNTAPGGLGLQDVDGNARIQGAAVDIGAFESDSGALQECIAGRATLCLNGNRFRVEVDWRTADLRTGQGLDVGLGSDDSGLFYFFDPDNWEMLIKVLDGCGINNRYWVFASATTNVEYTLRVTDTQTGREFQFFNPLGTASAAVTDTAAFATCP